MKTIEQLEKEFYDRVKSEGYNFDKITLQELKDYIFQELLPQVLNEIIPEIQYDNPCDEDRYLNSKIDEMKQKAKELFGIDL